MNFRPLEEFVVLQLIKSDNTTKGGIVVPEYSQSEFKKAKVLAVGPGRYSSNGTLIPMGVSVGDVVLIGSRSDNPIDIEGVQVIIINQSYILGVL